MAKRFTWERGPFEQCPGCQKSTFGILSAGGDHITLRCTECRYSHSEMLPELNKRVIYLDQSIFSLLFQVEAGGRLPPGQEDFGPQLYSSLQRVVLLQQVILPHSDIHHDETTVFHSANDLRAAYKRLGGDSRLMDTQDVELRQMAEYAKAFIDKREPNPLFSIDEVLKDPRNRWLKDMHIHVNANYQMFADGIRHHRDRSHDDLLRLVGLWQAQRPRFEDLLNRELSTIHLRPQALLKAIESFERIVETGDPMAIYEAAHHPHMMEHQMLSAIFQQAGVPEAEVGKAVLRFWQWERNLEQPNHRISSYVFAAIGRRVVGGQRSVNRGMMNDVKAIAAYAPYVDAMFVDRECASILGERRLQDDLQYKARIFSFANRDAFLTYLDELERKTPEDVRAAAKRIYDVS